MARIRTSPRVGTPWGAIASLLMAVLYGVSPIDLIPDILPLIGWVDDTVVGGVLLLLALRLFLVSRKRQKRELAPIGWRGKG